MTGLQLRILDEGRPLEVDLDRVVIAGFTGRNGAAVQEHIDELARAGVAAPASVPSFYMLEPGCVTTSDRIVVVGDRTSGEVEPILIRAGDSYFLGVGSDHTDRDVEQRSILQGKAACPKPIAGTVIRLRHDFEAAGWDSLIVWSEVDGVSYQHGSLGALRPTWEMLGQIEALGVDPRESIVIFGGTVSLSSGQIRFGSRWKIGLELPSGTSLTHSYDTVVHF